MPPAVPHEELYVPRILLIDMGGFTSSDLTDFLKRNFIEKSVEFNGYPIYAVCAALNKERKKRRFGEDNDVEQMLKTEKVQEVRIKNQERLGQLIPKEMAKDRVRKAFQAVANKIKYSIKLIAPRVAISNNATDCENICAQYFNEAIDMLSLEAKDISWEADGVETKLGRTELVEDSFENTSDGSGSEAAIAVEG